MLFKNILLGLSGSAAIGGIGYGIYASSQSNSEEKSLTRESEEVTGLDTKSSVDNEGNSQKEGESPSPNNNDNLTTGGANGASGEQALNTNGTTPGIPLAA